MKFFWQDPKPKFGKKDLAVIVDRKTARYLFIKSRRWDTHDREWMYEGTVLVIKGGILEFSAKDSIYSEGELLRIRGL